MKEPRKSIVVDTDLWEQWRKYCTKLGIRSCGSRMGYEADRLIRSILRKEAVEVSKCQEGSTKASAVRIPINRRLWTRWEQWCKKRGIMNYATHMGYQIDNLISDRISNTSNLKEEYAAISACKEELGKFLKDSMEAHTLELNSLLDFVKMLKSKNHSQLSVYRALEDYRKSERVPGSVDDILLEAMDVVYGYCYEDKKIWPATLSL